MLITEVSPAQGVSSLLAVQPVQCGDSGRVGWQVGAL